MIGFVPSSPLAYGSLGWGRGAGSQPLLPKTHVCDALFMGNGVAPVVADTVLAVLDRVQASKPIDEDPQ
jgi:hypothetical protein